MKKIAKSSPHGDAVIEPGEIKRLGLLYTMIYLGFIFNHEQSENSVFAADIFGAHFILTNTHDFDQKTEKSNFDTKINV